MNSKKKFISQQDYLDKTPEFCKFLYEEATEKKLSIKEYIDLISESNIKKDKIKKEQKEENTLENSILNTSLDDLQRISDWFGGEFARTFKTLTKFENFMDLYSTEKESSAPDFDELDKLMRYQTALQRQVSTSIGELLALTK